MTNHITQPYLIRQHLMESMVDNFTMELKSGETHGNAQRIRHI